MDPRYSNYPRANVGVGGSTMGQRPPGAHFEFISEAFTIIRADLGTWIGATFVSVLLNIAAILPMYVLLVVIALTAGNSGGAGAAILTFVLLIAMYSVALASSIMSYLGMSMMALQASRGERPQISELFAPFRRFVPVFATCLIVSIIVYVGLVFFIVPGLIAAGLFALAPHAAYEQNLSPGEAMKWSMEKLKPHVWGMIGLLIVASIVGGIGSWACGVGYLFTGSVPGIVLGLTYATFRNPEPAPFMPYPPSGPVPPSGTYSSAPTAPPSPSVPPVVPASEPYSASAPVSTWDLPSASNPATSPDSTSTESSASGSTSEPNTFDGLSEVETNETKYEGYEPPTTPPGSSSNPPPPAGL